jgi:hypothetical protein
MQIFKVYFYKFKEPFMMRVVSNGEMAEKLSIIEMKPEKITAPGKCRKPEKITWNL